MEFQSRKVIILEDCKFDWEWVDLHEVAESWEAGEELESIAKRHAVSRRSMFLALFYLADEKVISRPFAYRIGSGTNESK